MLSRIRPHRQDKRIRQATEAPTRKYSQPKWTSSHPKQTAAETTIGASSAFPYGESQLPPPRNAGIADHLARRARLSPSALEDFTEPEPVVEHLLELFWTYQASQVLVVDRQIFLRHHRLARESDGIGNRDFYISCLLYAIMALGSLTSTDKAVRQYSAPPDDIAGDWFDQRARILFEAEMEVPTVTTVQAAILIGS